MPYVAPATVVSGTTAPASWGNSVKAATDYLANPPMCQIRNTVSQSIANSTWTAQLFNTEIFDTNAMHDTVSNTDRVTIATAGVYIVQVGIAFASNVTGLRLLGISKNSVAGPTEGWHGGNAMNGAATHLHFMVPVKCIVGDILRCMVWHTAGVALNTILEDQQPHMHAIWVGLG